MVFKMAASSISTSVGKDTSFVSLTLIEECILCGKPPKGKTRKLFRCANVDTNVPLTILSTTLQMDLSVLQGTGCKYCLGCFNIVEKFNSFKCNLSKLMNVDENKFAELSEDFAPSTPKHTSQCKRLQDQTPTPFKGRHIRRKLNQSSEDDHTYGRSKPLQEEASDMFVNEFKILDQSLSDSFSQWLIELDTVLDNLCSENRLPGPSCLRARNEDLIHSDFINSVILELERASPKLLQILQVLCSPLHNLKKSAKSTVAMMYAMGMYCRNERLSAVQRVLMCACIDCHANNRLMKILHESSLSLSESYKPFLVKNLAQMNTHGIIKSIRAGISGKLTADNIDGRTIATQMRLSSGITDYHYTASTYIPDRCDLRDLPDNSAIKASVGTELFCLTNNEELLLKNSFKVLIGRILVEYFPKLSWMKKCIPEHMEHKYSEEMNRKSEIYPLKVIMKDPKYTAQCIEVMQECKDILKNCYTSAGFGEEFQNAVIPIGGDQLVRVRMKSALGLMQGAHTAEQRLDMFRPVIIEMFHLQQDFLDKLFAAHWKSDTVRSAGTLANFKALLRRTSVSGEVKKNFRAHDDFIVTVTEALVLNLAMHVLGMADKDSEASVPLPDNINHMHMKNRIKYMDNMLDPIVNQLYIVLNEKAPQHLNVTLPDGKKYFVEVDGKLCIPGKTLTIDLPGTTFKVHYIVPDSVQRDDHVYNYCIQLLRWSILYLNIDDSVKEGDPFRLNVTLKAMLPFFYSQSSLSKYAIEIIDYVLKTEALLSPRIAMRVRLGSFVNPKGIPGKNKAADMQQENNVKMIKRVIKGLGAKKSDKTMSLASAAAPPISLITSHYEKLLNVHLQSGKHTNKSRREDVTELLNILNDLKPFHLVQNRKLRGFEKSADPFHYLDGVAFKDFIQRTMVRSSRTVNRY